MKQALISVIIPVYNVEKYINRCIESVIHQTYTNLEIILIDDGSTDKSGQICDEYRKIDNRVKVIHKVNGGLSEARNVGLERMSGEYVAFIDSDDYVDVAFIEKLFQLLVKYNADIAISGFATTTKDSEVKKWKNRTEVFTKNMALKEMLYQKKYNTSAWAKLYKSTLFQEVRYPIGKIYEDICTTYKLIDKSEKIVFNPTELYFYYKSDVSIIRSKFNIKKMDYIENTKILLEFIEENYPSLQNAAEFRYLWSNIHVWVNIPDRWKYCDAMSVLEENITKYRRKVVYDRNVPVKSKIIIVLSFLGWQNCRKIYLLGKK